MNEDDESTTIIIPADARCKALVFFWFGDDGDGTPDHEIEEHPIIAWEVWRSASEERATAAPIIAAYHGYNCEIALLYEDGRVIAGGDSYPDRDAFEQTFAKRYRALAEAQKAAAA